MKLILYRGSEMSENKMKDAPKDGSQIEVYCDARDKWIEAKWFGISDEMGAWISVDHKHDDILVYPSDWRQIQK